MFTDHEYKAFTSIDPLEQVIAQCGVAEPFDNAMSLFFNAYEFSVRALAKVGELQTQEGVSGSYAAFMEETKKLDAARILAYRFRKVFETQYPESTELAATE